MYNTRFNSPTAKKILEKGSFSNFASEFISLRD